jgi:hypothetical protein
MGFTMFPTEESRSRALGGTSAVTSRLTALGLAQGRFGFDEALGTQEARDRYDAIVKSNKKSGKNAKIGQPGLPFPGMDVGEKQDERGARRKIGGIFPESMKGASEAQREAQRRTGLRDDKPASKNPDDRKDAEEYIRRTARLVSKFVDQKEYEDAQAMKKDIKEMVRQKIKDAMREFQQLGSGNP